MSLPRETSAHKDFIKHITLFIVIHIIINMLLRTGTESMPQFFPSIQQSILEGEIWFYQEQTGIFITFIWFVILIGQGFYVFFIKNTIKQEGNDW
ncbi:2TM domain-containing protein [Virgibacillus salexigens]|uniref:2TM domain-containing protein n=1 Tax=Virgibacillus kapii TaxID=1638645 RepID=A0ABQ2D4K8_9BACI|nr:MULTISPECIES: 2TM domain-containing protein [Virgibacillus]GGJ45349.1 hypothetical protein GCM10007111_04230 [Virgibacillus kapii]